MNYVSKLALVLPLALLAACTTATGVEVYPQTAQQFAVGRTKVADVTGALGEPTQKIYKANGTNEIVYEFEEEQPRILNFIPVVNWFVNQTDTRSTKAVFVFDQSGTLRDYEAKQTKVRSVGGILTPELDPVNDQVRWEK